MATKNELALRLLRKLGVVGAGQTASADDLLIAEEKIVAAHDTLVSMNRARWTLNDVPGYAAEGYVLMALPFAGPEFGQPADAGAMAAGMRLIAAGASLGPSQDPITSESF